MLSTPVSMGECNTVLSAYTKALRIVLHSPIGMLLTELIQARHPMIQVWSTIALFPPEILPLTLFQMKKFRLFRLKKFADNNFRFDENCRKFSKRVENTVEKGEIARSYSVFQRLVLQTSKKSGLNWERVQGFNKHNTALTYYQTTNFRLFQTERVCR